MVQTPNLRVCEVENYVCREQQKRKLGSKILSQGWFKE